MGNVQPAVQSWRLHQPWLTDLINNIVKEGCIPDDWRKSMPVPVYNGKGDPLVGGSYRASNLLEQPMKVLERVLERILDVKYQLITCNLASCLAREPLMLFSTCGKYKRNTKQGKRSCTMLLWIRRRNLIEVRGRW